MGADADGTPHRTVDYDDLIIPVDGADGTEAVVLAVPYLRSDVISGESYSEGVSNFMSTLMNNSHGSLSPPPESDDGSSLCP